MAINTFLKRRKNELDMSLSEIEAKLALNGYQVTKGAVQHWVSGARKPPLKDRQFLEALSIVFKMTIPEMLEQMELVEEAWPTTHTPEALEAANIIDTMPAAQRRKVVNMLEALRGE